jgi:hypothetical protein
MYSLRSLNVVISDIENRLGNNYSPVKKGIVQQADFDPWYQGAMGSTRTKQVHLLQVAHRPGLMLDLRALSLAQLLGLNRLCALCPAPGAHRPPLDLLLFYVGTGMTTS